MRSDDGVLKLPERRPRWQWLRLGDIDFRTGGLLAVKCLHQGRHVAHIAPRQGDEVTAPLDRLELRWSDQALAVRGVRSANEYDMLPAHRGFISEADPLTQLPTNI